MANVLSAEKRQQVIALGRLGWSLRRIEEATGVRRETASVYLRAAGVVVRPPGRWGQPPKPAIEVSTDSGAGPASNPALEVHRTDGEEVMGAWLLIKMLSDFQAAIIVLERGLVLQGQELPHCAVEALFLIKRAAELLPADAGRHAAIAHYGFGARLEFRKAARSPGKPAVRSDRRGLPSASSSRSWVMPHAKFRAFDAGRVFGWSCLRRACLRGAVWLLPSEGQSPLNLIPQ